MQQIERIAACSVLDRRLCRADIPTPANTFVDIIRENRPILSQIIDKYIGDAVMAIFGAPQDDPNHAANAVRAGLEICGQTDALTESLISKSGVPCQFGVGIHSGPVVAGNIGSSSRFNYTVIGDTVNVASRLESFGGRVYDSRLIVTREVVDLCPNIGFVLLGEVNLKGRQQAAEIYTAQSIDPNSH